MKTLKSLYAIIALVAVSLSVQADWNPYKYSNGVAGIAAGAASGAAYGALGGIGGYGVNPTWSNNVWGNESTNSYGKSGDSFARGEAIKSGDVMAGTVVDVLEVKLEATSTATTTGTVAGGAVGGIIGASIGETTASKTIGGILGGVLGSAVGSELGKSVSEKKAGQIIVETKDGRMMYVVQADGLNFQPGQSVFIIASSSGGMWGSQNIRVIPRRQ